MGINVVVEIKSNVIDNSVCIQCGACIDNCPKKVLSYGMLERNKLIYTITDDGHKYLKEWLTLPVEKDELRYETLLKLFFGNEKGTEQVILHIEAFEEKTQKRAAISFGSEENPESLSE